MVFLPSGSLIHSPHGCQKVLPKNKLDTSPCFKISNGSAWGAGILYLVLQFHCSLSYLAGPHLRGQPHLHGWPQPGPLALTSPWVWAMGGKGKRKRAGVERSLGCFSSSFLSARQGQLHGCITWTKGTGPLCSRKAIPSV